MNLKNETSIHPPSRRVPNQKMEAESHVVKAIILIQRHNLECHRGVTGEGQNEVETAMAST